MVKKKYVLQLILFILLSVMPVGCNRTESNLPQKNQTEKPIYTVNPAAHTASPKTNREKPKSVTVTDETGEKHKLKLGEIDEADVGVRFGTASFMRASQISDGHYYYLHVGKGGKNTIYRDKKIAVGTFFVREGEISGFAKVGADYFACITHEEIDSETFDIGNITYDIVRIDLAAQSVKVLLGNCAWDGESGEIQINKGDIIFYGGNMYYDSRTDVLWEWAWGWADHVPGAFLLNRNLKNIEQENKMICTKQMKRAKPYLTFVDGKILYGIKKGKKVSLYMFDLETKEQTKVVEYKSKRAYVRYQYDDVTDGVPLSVDGDYIYCQDMAIPRRGGKIQPLLKSAVQYSGRILFSSNKKYIFYVDKKYHLHRIHKKTGEDKLISKKKLMSVECMEDRIYVKAWRHDYWDWDWEEEAKEKRPDILYCMDLNGKIKWKHTLEKREVEDDSLS